MTYSYDKFSSTQTRLAPWRRTNRMIEVAANTGFCFSVSASFCHTNTYVWGLDISGSLQGAGGVGGLLAVVRETNAYFTAYDGNGNVSEYVDASGDIAAHYEYSPFGETIVATGPNAKDFAHRFSTKPAEDNTGLVLYEYRPYSPSLGRWLSRDPIGEWGGLLLYVIGNNDPLNRIDPLGLASCTPWVWFGQEWLSTGKTRDVEYAVALITIIQILDPTFLSNLAGTWYRGDREAEDELNTKYRRVCMECSLQGIQTYVETKYKPTGITRWRYVTTLYYRGEPPVETEGDSGGEQRC